MIPKIVHYCWFGKGEKSDIIKKCMETWKRNCHGYEFMEWNETNFDVNMCEFTRGAYENKKWAFVSDVARLVALKKYGGFYIDTDVEILAEGREHWTSILIIKECLRLKRKDELIHDRFSAVRKMMK